MASGGTSTGRSPATRSSARLVTRTRVGAGDEQVAQEGGGVEDLLEVVEDQEQAQVTQRGLERLDRRAGPASATPTAWARAAATASGVWRGDRRPGDLAVEGGGARSGDCQREPGLADPARADQGDEAGLALREHGGRPPRPRRRARSGA